ncbi:MAG: type II secretion system protein GspG [Planctomycetaceae bacterium]|jgi:hypothetical protein|nr:type II secretion system protein GspG [Planctomycetaceae bacterium]
MPNETNPPKINDTQSSQQKLELKRLWWIIPSYLVSAMMLLGIETLFMFQNIPLLAATIFLVGSIILIEKLLTRLFGRPKPRTWKAVRIALIHVVIFGIYIVMIVFVMRYYVPTTAISEKTTYITKPLTPDGLEIDVIGAITERFSPKCKPAENGFRYVIERFGIKYFLGGNDSPDLQKDISNTIIKQLEISNIEPTVTYQPIYDYFIERFESIESIESIDQDKSHEQNIAQEDQKPRSPKTRADDAISLLCKKSWNANSVMDGVSVTDTIHWLEANGEALDEFGKAVRFPVYYAPILTSQDNTPNLWNTCYEYTFHQVIVRELRIRIMYNLGVGDFEKAKYDVMTIIKLADRQMRYFGTYTRFFAAGSMFHYSRDAVLDLICFGNLTKQQLEQLQLDLHQYRTMPEFDDLMFIIRMHNIDSLYRFNSLRFDPDPDPNYNLTPFELEITKWGISVFKYFAWTPEFTKQQVRLDRLEKLFGNGFSRKQWAVFNEQYEKKDRLIDPEDPFYQLLILFFWKGLYQMHSAVISDFATKYIDSDITSIISVRYKMEALERLLDIAFALELYRHDHGQYPASLEELVEKYIEKIPDDPYTDGKPFHYDLELQPNTGYLLYSVGANGNDDNGIGWGYGDCNKIPEQSTNSETNNKNITDQKQSNKLPKSGDDIRIRRLRDEHVPRGG